ncbi:MAG: nucleotidyl transferase AbiEii/AbiGii toxin family protein, partial [Victivallales bacterium]
PGLLKEAGLAAIKEQNLSIKLEIDTVPPSGAGIEKTLVTRQRIISMQHYDLPSLMAGKIHALITRRYDKGRDWYDLLWYRGHRPPVEPNQVLLQNALDQTQGGKVFKAAEWKKGVLQKLDGLDCHTLKEDVLPFLEHPEDAGLFSKENFRSLLDPSQ